MDFLESKNNSAREIALAFGVPPQLLGIPGDNTYSNLAEARLSLWEQTIIPQIEELKQIFNNILLPLTTQDNRNFEIGYNKENITALLPRREKLWERVSNATFLTDEEKRKLIGLDKCE